VLSGEDRRLRADALRLLLWGLTPLYGAFISLYRGFYDAGFLREVRLPVPVVSIGNLTAGGTGKTGLTLSLTRQLRNRGLRPALLNYGYKAKIGKGPAVAGDGERVLLTPEEAGDEAVMLAESVPGTPVLIGKRRIESGALALEKFRPDLLILDDGFQYWRLARDVNIVLMNATQPWGYGAVHPRGLLRELPWSLRRATAIVLTHGSQLPDARLRRLKSDLARLAPRIPLFQAEYSPVGLTCLETGTAQNLNGLSGARIGALSGLGSPADFERSVARLGAEEIVPYRFPDHYAYQGGEVAEVLADACGRGLDALVTTAKDAVKLKALGMEGISPRIFVLHAELKPEPDAAFQSWIAGEIESASRRLAA
jgi:tetraacyldisaccharide 4'-kinase